MNDWPRRLMIASTLSVAPLVALAYLGRRWSLAVAVAAFLAGCFLV